MLQNENDKGEGLEDKKKWCGLKNSTYLKSLYENSLSFALLLHTVTVPTCSKQEKKNPCSALKY